MTLLRLRLREMVFPHRHTMCSLIVRVHTFMSSFRLLVFIRKSSILSREVSAPELARMFLNISVRNVRAPYAPSPTDTLCIFLYTDAHIDMRHIIICQYSLWMFMCTRAGPCVQIFTQVKLLEWWRRMRWHLDAFSCIDWCISIWQPIRRPCTHKPMYTYVLSIMHTYIQSDTPMHQKEHWQLITLTHPHAHTPSIASMHDASARTLTMNHGVTSASSHASRHMMTHS